MRGRSPLRWHSSSASRTWLVRRLLRLAALAASLALIFGVTLRPADAPNRVVLAPWTHLHPIDVVGNVALFAVPAAVLWSMGWSLRRTVLAAFVLSLGIELLQLGIHGRTTAIADVLWNTAGAAVGWLVAANIGARVGVVPEHWPKSATRKCPAPCGSARDTGVFRIAGPSIGRWPRRGRR